ncbi:MAG TPA: ATP synthase F1 subunit epsilon [Fimbriimonadaceae bacterium]|nr:ATP synthase F1 subunit epsilon [Fimbriimonadaceae bacterium]HRJ33770.1 ATP synthase F1 subunit epsilon [Fimbriimonadaceae bacterium]
MATLFKLSVVAPDRTVVEEQVQSLVAPAINGYLGVMANHTPVIAALRTGLLEYRDSQGQQHFVSIAGGFLEVSDNAAIILAEDAQLANEIDVKEWESRLETARKALRGEDSSMTSEQATQEIELAVNRIKAARLK